MFTNKKKEVLATFQDEKGIEFQLIKESLKKRSDKDGDGKSTIGFYRGKELISPWDVERFKLDFSKSKVEEVNMLLNDYLQTSSIINHTLQRMNFPIECVLQIWNSFLKDQGFIKETLLKYQDVLVDFHFVESLSQPDKWLLLTQNKYRTRLNMKQYKDMFQEVVAYFLHKYLSKQYIARHERVYGEWKFLMSSTFDKYYSDSEKTESINKAIQKTQEELLLRESDLQEIRNEIFKLDEEYEKAPLSQKYKIEECVKNLVQNETEKLEEIQEIKDKIKRIEVFFFE